MSGESKEVGLVSIGFSPGVGGIETHFDDLVASLVKRDWRVRVLTYQPVETQTKGETIEKRKGFTVVRLPILRGLFYRLVKHPFLEFVYLFPGLFLSLPFFLLAHPRLRVLHTHGLVAGTAGLIWGKIFGKRTIVTTHSIYHFPSQGPYRRLARWIFKSADQVLTLSKQSKREVVSLGIPEEKVTVFTYWINQQIFKPLGREKAKKEIGWEGKFVVFFVGRLIKVKGILELLKAAQSWNKKIVLAIAGTGPLEAKVKSQTGQEREVVFLGRIDNQKLPLYYSAADLLIVPSTHEEGFGRVTLEALCCGTPVIGANRGAIPEALDERVGRLIEITPKKIKETVEFFYDHPQELAKLTKKARKYAEEKFSERNVRVIIGAYQEKDD